MPKPRRRQLHPTGSEDEWDSSGKFRARAVRPGTPEIWGRLAQIRPDRSKRSREVFAHRVRPVPYFPQVGYADCGPACLYMAMAYFGIDVDISVLREDLGLSRDGVSASAIIRVARSYGLDARGVRVGMSALRNLGPGSILFWRFNHFVVVEQVQSSGIMIVDPTSGRRLASFDEVDASFTGVAIELSAPQTNPRPARRRANSGPWQVLAQLLPRDRGLWLTSFAASALVVASSISLPMIMRTSINSFGADAPPAAVLTVALLTGVAVAGLMHLVRSSTTSTLQGLFEERTGRLLVTRLLNLEFLFFLSRHPGDLAQRVRIGNNLRQLLSSSTVGAGLDAVLVTAYLILMVAINLPAALMALLLLGVAIMIAVHGARAQSVLAATATDTQVRTLGLLHEVFETIGSVKALGAESEIRSRWMRLFAEEMTAGVRSRRHQGRTVSLITWLQFATPAATFAIGLLLIDSQWIDLGSLVAISTLSASLFASVVSVTLAMMQLASARPELERVSDILTAPVEKTTLGRMPLPAAAYSVSLARVSYRYPGNTTDALEALDLHVEAGAYVGVIGASGSGKSTLGMLLAGLAAPTRGAVSIAEHSIAELDPQRLRQQMGYVDQSSRLISGSILDNIRLGDPAAGMTRVRESAKIAEIDEFVTSLPMGYETVLGSRGEGISGGQRQRIALARALLRRPRLIILDEATSAVDPVTEARVLRNIRASTQSTLIVIAHRLNLVEDADRIALLHEGKLAAYDRPEVVSRLRRGDDFASELMF